MSYILTKTLQQSGIDPELASTPIITLPNKSSIFTKAIPQSHVVLTFPPKLCHIDKDNLYSHQHYTTKQQRPYIFSNNLPKSHLDPTFRPILYYRATEDRPTFQPTLNHIYTYNINFHQHYHITTESLIFTNNFPQIYKEHRFKNTCLQSYIGPRFQPSLNH